MALRIFEIDGNVYGTAGPHRFWAEIRENSRDTSNRRTNVTVRLRLQRSDGTHYGSWNGFPGQNSITLSINGNTGYHNGRITIDTRTQRINELGSWTGNINHDGQGAGNFQLSAELVVGGASVYLDGGSINTTVNLTSIPSIESPTIGGFSVINRTISGFTIAVTATHPDGIDRGHATIPNRANAQFNRFNGNVFHAVVTGLNGGQRFEPNTIRAHFTSRSNVSGSALLPLAATTLTPVSGINFSAQATPLVASTSQMRAGDSRTHSLSASATPVGAYNRNVIYTSLNTNVATVNRETGVVSVGANAGEATIRMTSNGRRSNGTSYVRDASVSVITRATGIEPMFSGMLLNFNGEERERTQQAHFRIIPANATLTRNANTRYEIVPPETSSGEIDEDIVLEDIATVDRNRGIVTAVGPGVCRIKATFTDGNVAGGGTFTRTAYMNLHVTGNFLWRQLRAIGDYLNYYDVAEANENMWFLYETMGLHHDYDFSNESPQPAFANLTREFNTPISDTLRNINFVERNIGAVVRQMDFASHVCSDWDETANPNETEFVNYNFQTKRFGISEIPTRANIQRWIDFCAEFDELMEFDGEDQLRVLRAESVETGRDYELRARCEETGEYHRIIAHDSVIPETSNN